jgi:hypothetical protein
MHRTHTRWHRDSNWFATAIVAIIVAFIASPSAWAQDDPCDDDPCYDWDCPGFDECDCGWADPCDCDDADPCECGWGDDCECGWGDPCDCDFDPCDPDCGWVDCDECWPDDPCDESHPCYNVCDCDWCDPDCDESSWCDCQEDWDCYTQCGGDPCNSESCPGFECECYTDCYDYVSCTGGDPACECDWDPCWCDAGGDPCSPDCGGDPDCDPDCGGDPCSEWCDDSWGGDPCDPEALCYDPCDDSCDDYDACACDPDPCDETCDGYDLCECEPDVCDCDTLLPVCSGDINGDGATNVSDMLSVIDQWGQTGPPKPSADVAPPPTGDCVVNIQDLISVIDQWGVCEEPSVDCACDDQYNVGDRVQAAVDNPQGAGGILAGHCGTVLCGRDAGDEFNILIEWDDWYNGHDQTNHCECGNDDSSGTSSCWWVDCPDIAAGCGGGSGCDEGFLCGSGDPVPWCDEPSGCYCGSGYDGSTYCVTNDVCGAFTPCPTGDCPAGFTCIVDTCCATPICMTECDGTPNPVPPGSGPTSLDRTPSSSGPTVTGASVTPWH